MYYRQKYLKKIIPFINKDIIKVIVWQRRVWKSKLLLQVKEYLVNKFKVSEDHIVFVNKESLEFDNIKDYKDLYNYVKKFKYIFVDEVQLIEDWQKAILSLQNEWKDIYISWSNAYLLSSEISTILRWRYIKIEVFPFDWKEFLEAFKLKNTQKNFEKYIKYGGMPYLLNLDFKDEVIYEYLQNLYETIVLKDIIQRYKIKNVNLLERLLIYLAKNVGNLFSARNISKFLKSQKIKLSHITIIDYLKYLQNAFLIHEVKRYDLKWKQIFEIKEKYYFTDHGIRNAIIGWFFKVDIWWVLENIVYTNLVSNWWKVYIGEYKWLEIDFVAEKNGKTIYIQVAYLIESEETKKREFWNLLKIKDSWPKYVVSLDENASGYVEGIEWMSIRKFLNEIV